MAAHDECLRSAAYQQFLAGTHVVEALDREAAAQATLQRERRVAELSGTENLAVKHYAGESIVAAQDDLAKWWSIYVQNGGKAEKPQSLSRRISNPCR